MSRSFVGQYYRKSIIKKKLFSQTAEQYVPDMGCKSSRFLELGKTKYGVSNGFLGPIINLVKLSKSEPT